MTTEYHPKCQTCGHDESDHVPAQPTVGDVPGTLATCSVCLDEAVTATRKRTSTVELWERCRHPYIPDIEDSDEQRFLHAVEESAAERVLANPNSSEKARRSAQQVLDSGREEVPQGNMSLEDDVRMFLAMYGPNSGVPSDDPSIDVPRRVFEDDLRRLIQHAVAPAIQSSDGVARIEARRSYDIWLDHNLNAQPTTFETWIAGWDAGWEARG